MMIKAALRAVPYAGASLAGLYEDVRDRHASRVREVAGLVVDEVGEELLAKRMAENEQVDLLFLNAVHLASSTAFRAKRVLLAKVVRAAAEDDAKIEQGSLIVHALRNLDEPQIRALSKLRRVEDLARLDAPDSGEGSEEKVQNAVFEAGKKEPAPVLAALIQTGVVEPALVWAGGIAVARVTEFGRALLADLESEL